MNKKKQVPGLNTRIFWSINPRTRIHDNDIRKNKKQMRQNSQRIIGKDWTQSINDDL